MLTSEPWADHESRRTRTHAHIRSQNPHTVEHTQRQNHLAVMSQLQQQSPVSRRPYFWAQGGSADMFSQAVARNMVAISKEKQKQWQAAMTRYLMSRQPLRGLVRVMDIRHPLTEADWSLIELQQQGQSDLHILLTKSDKVSRNQVSKALHGTQSELAKAGVEATLQDFSALNKSGVDDAHAVLDNWLFDVPLAS